MTTEDEELASALARAQLRLDLVARLLDDRPELRSDPWAFADEAMRLWAERYPDLVPLDEDDVFVALEQVEKKRP